MTTDALPTPILDPAVPLVEPDPRDRFFDTSHLTQDLKRRTIRGGAVTLTAQAIKFVLRMGSTAILARLLTPADFGLIAMVTIVSGFAEMFKDAGLSTATVQRKSVTHSQISTLFWVNVALSSAIMILFALLSPVIAWFYGDQRLVAVCLATSGVIGISGFAIQHPAILRRKMQFTSLAMIDVGAMAAGQLTAIIFALLGAGYWSLVILPLVTVLTLSIAGIVVTGWIPGQPRRSAGLISMLRFGGGLLSYNVMTYFSQNMDNLLIGKYIGRSALGIYSKGYGLLLLPIGQITGPISSAVLPALSRLQDNHDRFRRAFRRGLSSLTIVTMPLVAFCFCFAPEIVRIVLGPQWHQAANVFRCLSPAAIMTAANVATTWVNQAIGTTSRQATWALITSPLCVVGFCIGLRFGVCGVASAYSIFYIVQWPVSLFYCLRESPVTQSDVYRAISVPILIASFSSSLAFAVGGIHSSDDPRIDLRCIVAMAIFIVTSAVPSAVLALNFRQRSVVQDAQPTPEA